MRLKLFSREFFNYLIIVGIAVVYHPMLRRISFWTGSGAITFAGVSICCC